MSRRGSFAAAVSPAIAAALAFATLLIALFALADSTTGHRYAEFPDPAMRIGLPPGYDSCEESSPSQGFNHYLICDHRREAQVAAPFAARYNVWVLNADASSSLGFDVRRGIESARDGIAALYFSRIDVNPPHDKVLPTSLVVRAIMVDGHAALELSAPNAVNVTEFQTQQRLVVIGLADGRLVNISNQRLSPLSPEIDATNFREIIRGIKFHTSS